MNTTSLPTCHSISCRRNTRHAGAKFTSLLAALMLALGLCSTWAEGPDDDYVGVVLLIDQADMLNANGKPDSAQAKYLEAQKQLVELKRLNPNYSPTAIAYRMKYLAGKIAPAPAKVNVAAGTAPSISGVQVKLISAGAEPRKALRFHPQTGEKQSLGMTITIAMAMTSGTTPMPAMKMPPMEMGMDVTVKEVSTEGDITYEATIADASVAADADTSPQLAGGFDAAMANLKGMTVTGVTTARGISKSVDFKLPAGANQQMQRAMDQVKTASSQISLPEEAVGVGAQWSVQRKLKSQGIMVDQNETYEITALDDDTVTLKTGMTQGAAHQKIESPMAPGVKVDISKMETKATGTTTLNLGKLMPTAGTMNGHTDMSMGMNVGGQPQTMSMKMDMTATIESK